VNESARLKVEKAHLVSYLRMMRKLLIPLAIILTACGGGGSGGSEAAASPATSVVTAPVIVDLRGDSTQAGLVDDGTVGNHPPSAIAEQILRQQTGRNITLVNNGVGSQRLERLLDGRLWVDGHREQGPVWSEVLASDPASVIVVNHEINNAIRNQLTPVSVFQGYLVQVVQQAQAAGKTVVIETPVPIVSTGTVGALFDQDLQAQHVQMMRDVARSTGAGLCDIYAAFQQANRVNLQNMPDGVHPSAVVYEGFIGPQLATCLLPYVH
jgi:hypothetical protein